MNPIQFDLGGGTALAIPADIVAERLIAELRRRPGTAPSPQRPVIGEYLPGQGGIYAGDLRGDDGVTYGLIVGDADHDVLQWGEYGREVLGASSTWDGLSNTNALRNGDHPAAKAAADHEADGHVDFYLPSRRELMIAAANAPHLFKRERYWTSSQFSESLAWAVGFEGGDVLGWRKTTEFRVRPFRRFTA